MDIEYISNFITSVGFPIFCCVMLFKQNKDLTTSINSNTDTIHALKDTIEELKDTFNNEKYK